MASTSGNTPLTPTDGVRRFFEVMDSDDADGVYDLLADDFAYTVLFGTQDGAQTFGGRLPEWRGYMQSRPTSNRPWHEVELISEHGDVGVAAGRTVLQDGIVATLMVTLQFDAEGKIRRYFAARTPAFNESGLF